MPQPASATAAQRQRNFVRAFLESVVGTGLSRVLGLAREMVLSAVYGAGAVYDAYLMAFTIPGTFRRFVADEGLTGAMIPALAHSERDGGRPGARRLADEVLTLLLLVNLAVCVLGVIFAEPLVLAFAWSWRDDPEKLGLATTLLRWMFPTLAMLSLVSYFEALLNFRGHFFVPKLAPGVVSAGIIAGALLLTGAFEEPIFAAAVGFLAGGILHVLIHLPLVWRLWGGLSLRRRLTDPRLWVVVREMGKVVLIGVFAQINLLVLRQYTAALPDGSVAIYHNATRVADLTWGLIAVAVGSAMLPNLSLSVTERAWDRFRDDLVQGFRLAAFVLVPLAAVLTVFAVPLMAVLFRRGQYSWEAALATASTIQLLAPYMLAVGGINIVKRIYFALDDRQTLLGVGALGVLVTAGFGALLFRPFGVPGLAAALSAATLTQFVTYVLLLRRKLGTRLGLDRMWGPLGRMGLATLPVVGVLWAALQLGDWSLGARSPLNAALFLGGLGGAAALYLLMAKLLDLREVDALFGRLASRLRRG